jgi:hypothetical protein
MDHTTMQAQAQFSCEERHAFWNPSGLTSVLLSPYSNFVLLKVSSKCNVSNNTHDAGFNDVPPL